MRRIVKKTWGFPASFNYTAWLKTYKDIKNLGAYLNLEREMGVRLSMKESKEITKKLEMMAEIVSDNLNSCGLTMPPPLWVTPKVVREETDKTPKKEKLTATQTEENKDG